MRSWDAKTVVAGPGGIGIIDVGDTSKTYNLMQNCFCGVSKNQTVEPGMRLMKKMRQFQINEVNFWSHLNVTKITFLTKVARMFETHHI